MPVAKESLPLYAHRFGPREFTRPQRFACLVHKTLLRRAYRGIAVLLGDSPDLRLRRDAARAALHAAAEGCPATRAGRRVL